MRTEPSPPSIWWWAFGYFAAYAPYAALTKAATSRSSELMSAAGQAPPSGLELMPSTLIASVIASYTFLWATGWWRKAGRRWILGIEVPFPRLLTALSGVTTGGIIITTTLAYTFEGVSIVFVMLLMRGGVLVLAPIIDTLTGRRVRWFSWVALTLTLASLFTSLGSDSRVAVTVVCTVDVLLYLACYFVRLNLMSRFAKSEEKDANLRYFVEEQLVSSPSLLLALAVLAVAGVDSLRVGFTDFFARPHWELGLLIGLLSQGTGIFGGLILLDRRENTFCVPVNRASSVLAGVVASYGLWTLLDFRRPSDEDLQGAALIVAAILFLSIPPALEKVKRRTG